MNDIQPVPLSEEQKWSFLETKLKNDNREYVARAINHALLESWQYEKTILAILELEDRAMLQKDNTHKVAFVKSAPKTENKERGYCNTFQRDGVCNRRNCYYRHEADPSKPTQLKSAGPSKSGPKPVDKHNRSKPFARTPAQLKAMTDVAGAPRGVVSDQNRDGRSNAQLSSLKSMTNEYANEPSPPPKVERLNSVRVEKRKYEDKSPSPSHASESDIPPTEDEMKLDSELSEYTSQRKVIIDKKSDTESSSQSDSGSDSDDNASVNNETTSSNSSRVVTTTSDSNKNVTNIIVLEDNLSQSSVAATPAPVHQTIRKVIVYPSESLSTRLRPTLDKQKISSNSSFFNASYAPNNGDSYNSWNFDTVSNNLITAKHCDTYYSTVVNSQIVSALHKVHDYYRDSTFIEHYSREDVNMNIRPRSFLFKKDVVPDEPTSGVRSLNLFGYEMYSNSHEDHIRNDITQLHYAFLKMIYNVSSVAWGAITIAQVEETEHFWINNWSIENKSYTPRNHNGYYYSVF